MIDHVSIGVRDISRTKRFYDAALMPLGYHCLSEGNGSLGYGRERSRSGSVPRSIRCRPIIRSGLHFCFTAPTRDSVDACHAAALGAGGSDNGKPGLRTDYDPNYYAAFIIDPDGYRIEALTVRHCFDQIVQETASSFVL